MNGRLEHELQINQKIETMLLELPDNVRQFYNNIRISKSPKTCIEYIRYIQNFIEYSGKDYVEEITDIDIQEYLNSIQYINKNGEIKKASAAYTKAACSALNQYFKYLYKRRIISGNPMDLIDRPMRKDSVKRIFLSMNDLNKILKEVENDNIADIWKARNYTILHLFMVTGIRNTALSEINVTDFDWKKRKLTIIDKRDKEQVYIFSPGTKKILMKWLKYRDQYLESFKIKEDAFFISAKKNRISPRTIYDIVQKYSKPALGYEISPHKLRAAFVSLYYKKTKDIEATKEAVGHSSISTTSLYITRSDNPRKKAATYMSKSLGA